MKIAKGELDIQSLYGKTDVEVTERLSELAGIGIWSAEMLMLDEPSMGLSLIFASLNRPILFFL